jgi:hypothetical protein
MPTGLDCKYMLLNTPLNHFIRVSSYFIHCFTLSFFSECSIYDSWILKVMEDLLLACPFSLFITQTLLFSLLSGCRIFMIYGFLRR